MSDTVIPKGSLVLVTGANGYIGSHIVDILLSQSYQVRGTARSVSKLDGLIAIWAKKYPRGHFEVAVVEDMGKDGAFDDAVKGVSGVVHTAANLRLASTVIEEIVDPIVNGTISILRSAATQPTITRFVLTSSSLAADPTRPNEVYSIDEDSWNEFSVEEAYKKRESSLQGLHVYAAGKVLGEKAAWKFVQDEKPRFVLNTILPSVTFGPVLDPATQWGSSASMLTKATEKEDFGFLTEFPQWFVDVRDVARLHILGLNSPVLSSPGARFWAVSDPFTPNDLLRIFRKIYPERKWREDFENPSRNLIDIDHKRGTELLGGKWIGLEESVRDTLKSAA